jgi:hypothetical protein
MDDDLQNPPEEVERLLAFAQRSGNDVTMWSIPITKKTLAWRNLGRRFTNRVGDFALENRGVYGRALREIASATVGLGDLIR